MGSSKVKDLDYPVSSVIEEDEVEEKECNTAAIKQRQQQDIAKLQNYVKRMAYPPTAPPKIKSRLNEISKPKRLILKDNYETHKENFNQKLRANRIKRILGKRSITIEQMEKIVKKNKTKKRKREDLLKRKHEIYYDLLTKLERQSRAQYLNMFIKKFARFVAYLATTMRIPPQLVDPYARMQRSIFCNIVVAIGMQASSQSATYYNSQDAFEYDVCHLIAHALLSLILKALYTASTRDPSDCCNILDMNYQIDNYIKDRLMCAAEKKILYERRRRNLITGVAPPKSFHKYKYYT